VRSSLKLACRLAVICSILLTAGYCVQVAGPGASDLQALHCHRIYAVTVDQHRIAVRRRPMTGVLDGIEWIRHVRSVPRSPVRCL
jgi:hypothetical protein